MSVLFGLISAAALAADFGSVFQMTGEVKIHQNRTTVSAKVGTKISAHDTIMTGPEGSAKIVTTDRNVIIVQPSSEIRFDKYINAESGKPGTAELKLTSGSTRLNLVQKYEDIGNTFRIRTPTAVAGVRGTEFLATVSSDKTTISTFTGEVQVAAKEEGGKLVGPVSVQAGFQLSAGPTPGGQPVRLSQEKLSQLNSQSGKGELRSDGAKPPAPPPNSPAGKNGKTSQAPGQNLINGGTGPGQNQNPGGGSGKPNPMGGNAGAPPPPPPGSGPGSGLSQQPGAGNPPPPGGPQGGNGPNPAGGPPKNGSGAPPPPPPPPKAPSGTPPPPPPPPHP